MATRDAPTLRRRRLGRTGIEVTELGFGGAGIGHAYGSSSDETCIAAVRRAVDLGIDFFDTSPVYGAGRSETNLGIGLEGARDRVTLATKVRLADERDLADMSGAIRRSVEASLKRLRTDRIDILQLHHQVGRERGRYLAVVSPPVHAMRLDRRDAMAFAEAASALVREGTVRFLGLTAWDGEAGVVGDLIASGAFATAQILYNMVNHSADGPPPAGFDDIDQGGALRLAARHDIGVIAIRSHAAGALADRLDRAVAPDSDVARDHERVLRLGFAGPGREMTLSAAALRFCIAHPAVGTVVPGFKEPAEVDELVRTTAFGPLSDKDLAALDRLYRRQFRT